MSKRPASIMDGCLSRNNKATKLDDNDATRLQPTAESKIGNSKTAYSVDLPWAGNICHPNDTSVCPDEELSGWKMNSPGYTTDELGRVLTEDATIVADNGKVESSTRDVHGQKCVDVERFLWRGHRIERRTYHQLDATTSKKKHYADNAIASHINTESLRLCDKKLTDEDTLRNLMADMAVNDTKAQWTKSKASTERLAFAAYLKLYERRDDPAFLAKYQQQGRQKETVPPEVQAQLNIIKEKHKFDVDDDKYTRMLQDRAKAECCETVKGVDLVLLRDKNHRFIGEVWINAADTVWQAGLVQKMTLETRKTTWRVPFQGSDPYRHATNVNVHMKKFPEKNKATSSDPHRAACGVEHIGLQTESGHMCIAGLDRKIYNLTMKTKFDTKKSKTVLDSDLLDKVIPIVMRNIYGIASTTLIPILQAFDKELYSKLIAAHDLMPRSKQFRTTTEGPWPFSYFAHLIDVQTEGHTDSTDWINGLAGLFTYGDFTGGDLVFSELGLRVPFSSGSHALFRGEKLYHYVLPYEGYRSSIVLTAKEGVRNAAQEILDCLEEFWAVIEKYKSIDAAGLNLKQQEMLDLAEKGQEDIVEWLYKASKVEDKKLKGKVRKRMEE